MASLFPARWAVGPPEGQGSPWLSLTFDLASLPPGLAQVIALSVYAKRQLHKRLVAPSASRSGGGEAEAPEHAPEHHAEAAVPVAAGPTTPQAVQKTDASKERHEQGRTIVHGGKLSCMM